MLKRVEKFTGVTNMTRHSIIILLLLAVLIAPVSAKIVVENAHNPSITYHPMVIGPNRSATIQSTSVPNAGISLTPSEALNKSHVLIKLSPLYKVYGAGAAFFPYKNIIVFYDGSTCRTPLFYDAEQRMFATVGKVEVMNIDTGKIVATYSPPAGHVGVFRVTSDGKVIVVAQYLDYGGAAGDPATPSVLLSPAGVVVVQGVGDVYLTAWPEVVYPNGTIAFGSAQELVGYNTTSNTFEWKYSPTYSFEKGLPSVHITASTVSTIITHTSNWNVSSPRHIFDDIYEARVMTGSGRVAWVTLITGQFAMASNKQLWNITTPDGINFWLNKTTYPWTGDLLFTQVLNPSFTANGSLPESNAVIGIPSIPGLNGEFYPMEFTKITDADIELPVGTEYWVAASNQWANDLCLINLLSGSVETFAGSPVKQYGRLTHPIYISGIATRDGRYIILLKGTNCSAPTVSVGQTVPVRLEIWEHSGSSLTLVKTLNYSLYLPTETTQPRSMAGITKLGPWQYYALPGGLIIYDTQKHVLRFYGFNGTCSGRLAAVSPDGRYCVLGDTVYQINYLLNIPAITYDGNVYIYHGAKDKNLMEPIVWNIPSDVNKYGYTMRVMSGKITIGSIYSKKRTVNLITNKVVGSGELYTMYKEGLIKTFQYTNVAGNGTVKNQKVVEGSYGKTCIEYIRTHELHPWAPYIGVGRVGSAIDINVPFDVRVPISQYNSINMKIAMAYGTIVPVYVAHKVLGLYFNEFGVGATAVIGSYLSWQALVKFAPRFIYDQLPIEYGDLVHLTTVGEAANVLSKASTVVGAALLVDGIAGAIMDSNAMANTQMHTYMMIAPVFQDSVTGQKYSIVTLFLPANANQKEWIGYTGEMLQKIGIKNYVVRVVTVGTDWKDYQQIFSHMSKVDIEKQANLLEGLNDLQNTYGVSPIRLRLVKVHIFIATLTSGRQNLWDWITGQGLNFMVITAVNAHKLQAVGKIPAQVITNPEEICNVLNPIYINSVPVNLTPAGSYAQASFILPAKCQKVVIQVNKPYYAALTASLYAQLIAPLHKGDGLYQTNFTYSWKYCFNETKIMFIGMPYKMVMSQEVVYTTHGNEPVNMTPYMSLIAVVHDNSSPTGVRYYYGTTTAKDMRLIDPHNAGLMEPGKKYHVEYWYQSPVIVRGDAAIQVMFNGTTVASTLPRHARVIITNKGSHAQTVSGYLKVIVGYEDKNHQFHDVDEKTYTYTLSMPPNSTRYTEWNIQKYVGEAISQYKYGYVGYVKLVGVITHAQYDAVKTNDFDSLVYYPPSSLTKVKPVVATFKVENIITKVPVPNATLVFDGKSYETNTYGVVSIATTTGSHNVSVTATGYHPFNETVLVYSNKTFVIDLIPSSYVIVPWNNSTNRTVYPIIKINNTTYMPVETIVQYMDGAPYAGANVTILNTSTGTVIGKAVTGATGYAVIYVPEGENVTDNVTAVNYTAQKIFVVNSPKIVQFTVPVNSEYFEPEVAVNNVSVWIHMGLGQIPEGLKMASVYHCVDTWFYTNVPQNITFEIMLINTNMSTVVAKENYTVHLHKGFQKVREFIPVNVSDFTTCQVVCKIVKYQYDTNPYNNYAVGNIVTFRPYIDIYTTIVWEPLKQKTEYGLLPGDTVKVCVALHVPEHTHVPDIHLKYDVMSKEVGKHKMKTVTAKSYTVNSAGGVSTIWYNYTMQLPWTNKVVVTANATCPYDLGPENNNASAVIPLSPDAALVSARVQSLAVSGGSVVPVRVTIKSNYVNTTGGISIIDETAGNATIGSASFNITAPLQTVVVNVHVPKVNKYSETHTWLVYVTEFNDPYPKDGMHEMTVTIWGFPSIVIIGIIFLFVLIVLLIIRHLLTIRPPRQGRYFKRVDSESRDNIWSAKIHYRKRKGKYFKKI